MAHQDLWTYRDTGWGDVDLVGMKVEALDGSIGKIDEASADVGSGYVVVDTGPWIFGKKVLLPAGLIDRVDIDDGQVYVQRTKDEIKNAPEVDENEYRTPEYRERLGSYYGPGGVGYYEGRRDYAVTGTRRTDEPL